MDLNIFTCSCLQELDNPIAVQPATPDTTEAPVAVTSRPDGGSSEDDQEEHCKSAGRNPESWKAITTATERLGMELLQNLETTPEQPNVIISPLSISLALSQLALGMKMSLCSYWTVKASKLNCCHLFAFSGAVNKTEELLMHHLHANTVPCYHQSLHNLLVGIRSDALRIATRIFVRQGYCEKNNTFISRKN